MSRCEFCLQGFCKKHPLQDHGRRAALLQSKLKESQASLLRPQSLIEAEIHRIAQKARGTDLDANELYRKALEQDRSAISSSSTQKTMDSSYIGLNPTVGSLMARMYGDDEGADKKKASSKKRKSSADREEGAKADSDSESDSSASSAKRRKRKHKKEKSKKHKKKRSKKSKSSKKKKSKSRRSDSSDSGSSSSSGSDGSSSESGSGSENDDARDRSRVRKH